MYKYVDMQIFWLKRVNNWSKILWGGKCINFVEVKRNQKLIII